MPNTSELTEQKSKTKVVHGLRLRSTDADKWSEAIWFRSKARRDKSAATNRILAGIRVWSFSERKTFREIAEIDFAD